MPQENRVTSQIRISIDNAPIPEEYVGVLQEAIVDDSTALPDMFSLRFRDDKAEMIDDDLFEPAKAVQIKAANEKGIFSVIFEGEITAVEPQFREDKIVDMVIRGYGKSHRMYREVKSRTFLRMKDSDIASKIAGEGGLSAQVEATSKVHDYVCQSNQTNMAFLMERAWRIGYECFEADGKLYFRKPPTAGKGITLTWGEDLATFRPVMSVAEQVDEVLVKGWDIKAKKGVVGSASKSSLHPNAAIAQKGKQKASSLGSGKKIVVNLPVDSQAEAKDLAQARLNELSGALIQATGTALRRPDLQAGQRVTLQQLGTRFSGDYLVTSVRHFYEDAGLREDFEVSGLRSGLLSDLIGPQEPVQRWPGAVSGIVTNNKDPDKLGRVKVTFPWLDETVESDWTRVVSPGAGKERGLFMLPEVDDEVVLVFDQGDFHHPYVLGGVWNGKDKTPPPNKNFDPLVRTWCSHDGHQITVDDTPQKKLIQIISASGDFSIILDDLNKKIEMKTKISKLVMDDTAQKVDLETTGQLNVKSTGPMSIKSDANVGIEGKVVDIKSTGPASLQGKPVNIN